MLASWLRMKYPHQFQGALAASAPILYFRGIPNEFGFSESITQSFYNVSSKIPSIMNEGFGYIVNATEDEYEDISTWMNLCSTLQNSSDLQELYEHLENGYAYMCMTNYPYPSNFLEPMPAWPVKETYWSFENVPETSTAGST